MSKTRVATGRGKVVRKSVRNQDDAYMDVWKLCERKWVFRSGSCSCVGRGRLVGMEREALGLSAPYLQGAAYCPLLTYPGQPRSLLGPLLATVFGGKLRHTATLSAMRLQAGPGEIHVRM